MSNTEVSSTRFAAAEFIKEIGRGAKGARGLTKENTEKVFSAMLAGEVSDLELGALLLAWRIKGESVEELAAMLEVAHASCHPIHYTHQDHITPVIIPSYNGARKQPNLVPLLALLLAREGVPVLVHGTHTFSNRITTAMLFEALGMPPCTSIPEAETQLRDQKLAFVPIEVLSPSLALMLDKRKVIGLRNSGHTIVKMLQPIGNYSEHEALRLVNYTHPEYLQTLTDYFGQYPSNVLLARGTEGEAVADARRTVNMLWIAQGQQQVMAEAIKGSVEVESLPSGLDVAATVEYIHAVLADKIEVPKPIAEQVRIIKQITASSK